MKIWRLVIFLTIIFLLSMLSVYYPKITGKGIKEEYQKEPAFATRVIDGDTIVADNNTHIRLLGINAPEKSMKEYAEAKNFLRQIENKSIEILRDSEDTDRYERKLRYVFYDNRLINAEILKQGLATYFMVEGLKYEKELEDAEEYARENELGLWKKSREICADCIKLAELNQTDEFFILENRCGFNCSLDGWIVKDEANHVFKLINMDASKTEKYNSKQKVWNDNKDRFFMRDKNGNLVVFYEYVNPDYF